MFLIVLFLIGLLAMFALEARGVYYGQRHLERLLSEAEQTADALWTDWMEQEVRNDRNQH